MKMIQLRNKYVTSLGVGSMGFVENYVGLLNSTSLSNFYCQFSSFWSVLYCDVILPFQRHTIR